MPLSDADQHLPVHLDVSKSASVINAFEEVIKHFSKPPTLLAQSAGITRDNFLIKIEEQQFDDVINVNLKVSYSLLFT